MEGLQRTIVRGLGLLLATFAIPESLSAQYPLGPDSNCGAGRTCAGVIDEWNEASWADLVDDGFQDGGTPLAAVRWYAGESNCTPGPGCNDQLQDGDGKCTTLDVGTSFFCGVTDEFSNVLFNHAMGSDQTRYQKLHNFAELLRHPSINNLQCWKHYVQGFQAYTSHTQLCQETDSAADGSIRILGAYAIACAKRQAGVWLDMGVDYCADYIEQGNAIWGLGTASHGEIKLLGNGEYYLANGYNNQVGAPANTDAFRPDYYELQFLMDFADFIDNAALRQGVVDMLEDYWVSIGDNQIHQGTTGHFNADTTEYFCDQLCPTPYMNNADTWRVMPALGAFLLTHPGSVPAAFESQIFDYWWTNYSGGHLTLYGPTDAKPFEIYSNSVDGVVKQAEDSYKTLGMWIPFAAAQDPTYATQAVAHLVGTKYDYTNDFFYGAAYHGGYYSQFAHRAVGSVSGMIDPNYWRSLGSVAVPAVSRRGFVLIVLLVLAVLTLWSFRGRRRGQRSS